MRCDADADAACGNTINTAAFPLSFEIEDMSIIKSIINTYSIKLYKHFWHSIYSDLPIC